MPSTVWDTHVDESLKETELHVPVGLLELGHT